MLWWTLRQLKSSNAATRAAAASRLAETSEITAVPSLIRALEDEDAGVRLGVIRALAGRHHPAAAEPLAAALVKRSEEARSRRPDQDPASRTAEYEALAGALGALGNAALPPLLRLVDSEDPEARRWVAHALGLIRNPEASNPLVKMLDDSRSEVRKAAALALGSIGSPGALEPLLKSAGSRDPETRRAAVAALGRLGSPAAVPKLIAVLEDPNEPLQLAAVEALGRIGGFEAGRGLRTAIDGGRKRVQEAAGAALQSLALSPASPAERAEVAVLMGDFAAARQLGAAAAGALVGSLASRDAGRRRQSVAALGELRLAETQGPLLQALRDYDPAVRQAAADALAGFGPAAVAALAALLSHHDPTVQVLASRALGAIGDARAAGQLAAVIEQNRTIPNDYPELLEAVRAAAAALEAVLRHSAPSMAIVELQRLAALPEPRIQTAAGSPAEIAAGCAAVRDLATAEIQRRGLPATPSGSDP